MEKKIKKQKRTIKGEVISDKMNKTVVVKVSRLKVHPKYKTRYKVTKHFKVHDEKNECHVGDKVIIEEKSPDGKYLATFYIKSGGGAAGWMSEFVSVKEIENNCISNVLELNRGYEVTIEWIGLDHVKIGYPDNARIDHFQSWFGRMANGKVEIVPLSSENGKLKK